jgi:hypothetical protein
MKRFQCPDCQTEYHEEPAECPVCLHTVEDGPLLDRFPEHANPRTPCDAANTGFAVYNNCSHFCLDVPDGYFTISTKLSDGRRVTFAFVPYEEKAPAQCLDIVYHDAQVQVPNGYRQIPAQNVITFAVGKRVTAPPNTTCTTLLLYDRVDTESPAAHRTV